MTVMRVGLFVPCLVDQFHPETARSTRRVLERVGARVHIPREPVCCGQFLYKAGLWKKTLPAAMRLIRVLQPFERVVAPSGSCVHMIRHHYPVLFQENPAWSDAALELSQKVFELSEFLVLEMGVEDVGASFSGRVTYHDSCQTLRGLGVSEEPRRLLKHVRGLELVEMDPPSTCCGFGGVFSFKFPDASTAMAQAKAAQVRAAGAEAVTACETSCLMHIQGALKQLGHPAEALHLADILAKTGSHPRLRERRGGG